MMSEHTHQSGDPMPAIPSSRFAAFLPHIGVQRPVTTIMTLSAMMIIGAIAYLEIPLLLFPEGYEAPFLFINASYRGSHPQEVERVITRPIEEMLRTVSGINEVNSTSYSSSSNIFVRFHQRTDMDVAFGEVRDRLDRLMADMPRDLERINIWKYNMDDEPVHFFVVAIDEAITDQHAFLDQHLRKALMRIDGVAKVEIWGAEEKIIQLAVNQDRVRAGRVNTYEMIERLRNDNFALASGYVRDGGKKMYVRSLAKFQKFEDIQQIRIQGANTGITDVGEIIYDVPEQTWFARVNHKPGVVLQVFKESTANTVDMCRALNAELTQLFAHDPDLSRMDYKVILDTGKYIEEAIQNLQSTGLWGGFFSFLVLYGFLRRVRITAVIALAIPLCLLVTVICLYFIGWSLNLLTLMGLMLCVGMVVDNAIVIMENIMRRRSEGYDVDTASLGGAAEVGLAITMSTLTSIVVFLPVILMEGTESDFAFFMLRIGLPVIVALLASLWMALLFIPFTVKTLPGSLPKHEPLFVSFARHWYHRMLTWTLLHRADATLVFALLLISIQIPLGHMQQTDQAEGHINDVIIRLQTPAHFSYEETGQVFRHYEDFFEQRRERYRINTLWVDYSKTRGDIQLFLQPPNDAAWWQHAYRNLRKTIGIPVDSLLSRDEVLDEIKEKAPKFAGVKFLVGHNSGNEDTENAISLRLYGEDTETLIELSDEMERRLQGLSNLVSIETSMDETGDEVQIRINRELARQYDVDPMTTAQTISYMVRGLELPDFHGEDRDINIRVGLQKSDRETLNQLQAYFVFSRTGREVALANIADFSIRKLPGAIRRENGKTYMRVTATTTSKDLLKLSAEVDALMQGFQMPRGYNWTKGERFDKLAEQNKSQMFAGILAITFVFFLMGVLFESFILPLSVVICIPFAFVGGMWMLYVTHTVMDLMVAIGAIILIGIVVNNAIVLVDLINRMRAAGVNRNEALLAACDKRLRPILMTALTTIVGLFPMAIGGAGLIGIPYAPMGRIMIGGLVSATFFTPLVVPLMYTYLDDLRTHWSRLLAGIFK